MDDKHEKTRNEDQANENQEPKTIDLDTFIEKEVGQFGKHQFKTVFVALLALALSAGASSEYIFTTARIKTRCFISECETASESKFMPSWISNALPKATDGNSFDECQRFARNISFLENSTNVCLPQAFDHTTLIGCEKYVYEHQKTIVYDFDLACNEWSRTFIGSANGMVLLISLPCTGVISDIWGRKAALTISVFFGALMGLFKYWTTSYKAFVIMGILNAFFMGGVYPTAYILAIESVGPKHRVLSGALIGVSDAVSLIIIGLFAWAFEYWQFIILMVYVPPLIIVFLWFFYSESIRWYVSKGRYNDSEKLLKEMARINNKQLSKNAFTILKSIIEEEQLNKTLDKQNRESEPCLPVLVFKHKKILIRCIVTPILWFGFVLIYYSLQVNSVNLSGNKYLAFVILAVIEIPAFGLGSLMVPRIRRRIVISISYLVVAASQMAYLFTTNESFAVSLFLYLIAKCSLCLVIQLVYLYTSELYPTKYRQSLLSFSSTIGRIGNIIAPLTPAFGDKVPYIIFVALACLCSIVVFITPETLNTKLPNTMEEASELSSTQPTKNGKT